MVIGLILFAILGLTVGYTVASPVAWFVLLVPVAFALITALVSGLDGSQILVLALALAITAGAVVVGRLIDRAFSGGEESS